jgi:hypothetical protein
MEKETMTDRLFLITVDLTDPRVDVEALQAFIQTSEMFENWWNHIPAVFIVSSSRGTDAIVERIRRLTGDAKLLVVEINPNESEGWLPDRAWRWLRKRTRETERRTA